jgi:hypothetical protein
MKNFRLIEDDSQFDPKVYEGASQLTLFDCLALQLSVSPDSKLELKISG